MWDCEFAGVCAVWYPQTNTVAFISAPLSGPAFTRADLQDTDSPQMEKPAAAGTGSPEAAVVRSSLHSRTGTTVRDWSATTELKDTDTPFRCKLCVRKKNKLRRSSCHHLVSSNGKQAQTICFSFARNYFCSPTHTHSETRTPLTHIERTAAVSVEQRTVSLALRSTSPWQHFLLRRHRSWTRSTHTYTQNNAV